jgi:hypothetical protein
MAWVLAGVLVCAGCHDRTRSDDGGAVDSSATDSSATDSSATGSSASDSSAFVSSADPVPTASFPIRSVTLDARSRPSDATLRRIRELGTTHLTLIPFGFQRGPASTQIRMHTDGGWYSETDRGIRDLARRADRLGMRLILKPHVWIGDYNAEGQERDRVGFQTDAKWSAWEEHYRRFLMHYARLGRDVDAAVLVVGSELTRSAHERPGFWRSLIRDVRAVYDGDLTYAANWHDAFETISFWNALDYAGVQAYFPLVAEAAESAGAADTSSTASASGRSSRHVPSAQPSLDALVRGWGRHERTLRRIHQATGRPILFTEIGYRSAPDAASAPWRWPEDDRSAPPDPALQALCYRAFFHRFARVDWMAGAIVWKWHPDAESRRPTGFTPQHKPAEQVLRHGFGGASLDSLAS